MYISRVTEGGPAAVDGKLAVGDRIVSVRLGLNANYHVKLIELQFANFCFYCCVHQ